MARTYQSRGFICKTVSYDVLQFALDFCAGVSGSRWAYAQHVPAPPKVPHWHFVGLFEDRLYWKSVYDFAMEHDPCSSTDTCRKPRKAVRYLLHLDQPDKHPVPRESLISGGMWGPDELEDWLESTSVASSLVDTCLCLWRDGLSPLEALSRLVSFGFEPYQISASLQAYTRLCDFWMKQAPNALRRGMGTSSPHQGIHGAPPQQGEETQVSDNQGNKIKPSIPATGRKTEESHARHGTNLAHETISQRANFLTCADSGENSPVDGIGACAVPAFGDSLQSHLPGSDLGKLRPPSSDFLAVFPSARIEILGK